MKKKETNVAEQNLIELFVGLINEIQELKKVLHTKKRLDNRQLDVFLMDYTPSLISRAPITTQNEALEQIMLRNGMMSRETWETLSGVVYDAVGDNVDDDSFLDGYDGDDDGEFEQSRFASYYERKAPEKIEVPNVETKKVDVAPVPELEKKEVNNGTKDIEG